MSFNLEADLQKCETAVAKGVTYVTHLYDDVKSKLTKLEKDEPALVADVTALVTKGELFLATAASAITEKGLNLPADSAAYAAFSDFLKQFQTTAAAIKADLAAAK